MILRTSIVLLILVSIGQHTATAQGIPVALSQTMASVIAQDVGEFQDGFCAFSIDALWGFFDVDGHVTIPPVLDHVAGGGYPSFHNGLCLVRTPGATSTNPIVRFVDTRGVTAAILKEHVIDATQFSHGLAYVLEAENPEQTGFPSEYHIYAIDTKGKELPGTRQTVKDHVGRPELCQPRFHDGRSVARDYATHLHGYIDTTGVFVIPPSYVDAGIYSETFAAVRSAVSSGDLRWGFINSAGRMIIEPRYEHQPGYFSSGRAGFVSDASLPHMIGYLDTNGAIAIYPRNSFNGSMDVCGQPNARAWKVGSATLDASTIQAQPVPFMKGLVVAVNPEADPDDILILNPTGGVVKRMRNPTLDWARDLQPWQIVVHTSINDSVHVIQHEKGSTLIAANGMAVVERIPNGYIRPFHSERAFLARFDENSKVYRTYFIDRSGSARIEVILPN